MSTSLFKLAMRGEAIRGHGRLKFYRRTEWLLPRSCGGLRYDILRKIMDDSLSVRPFCMRVVLAASREEALSILSLLGYEIPLYPFDAAVLALRVTKRAQLTKRV
jgi:hypothetical protein